MKELWGYEWHKHLATRRFWLVFISLLLLTAFSTTFQLRQEMYITSPLSQQAYDEYRKTVIQDAENKLTISIFADNTDPFILNNAHKIIKKYTECADIQVEAEPTQGVRVWCDSIYENIWLLFWVLFCVNIVVFEEKKSGQYSLQRTTKYGRKPLGVVKLLVLVLMAVGGMLVTEGVRLTVVQLTAGLGDLQRSLQSVYPESVVHMSVFEMIVHSLWRKTLAVTALVCLVFWLSQYITSGLVFIWTMTAFFAISFAVYLFLPGNSWLSLCKEINLWTFLNSTIHFTRYKNLSLFSKPLDYSVVSLGVMTGMVLLFGITASLLYGKKAVSPLQKNVGLSLLRGRHSVAFVHEGYKLLFIAGWWMLVVALPIGMYGLDEKYHKYESLSDYYELQYCHRFEGAWNEAYEQELTEEVEKAGGWEAVDQNIGGSPQVYALAEIKKKADYLSGVENGYLLYEKGYHALLITKNGSLFGKQMAWIGVLLLISMGTIWFVEMKYDQIRLFRSTKYGLRRVRWHKKIYAVLISTMIFVITWSMPLYRIGKTYGSLKLSAPAASLEALAAWGSRLSVGGVLGLQFLGLYAVTVIFAFSMMKIMGVILGGTEYE